MLAAWVNKDTRKPRLPRNLFVFSFLWCGKFFSWTFSYPYFHSLHGVQASKQQVTCSCIHAFFPSFFTWLPNFLSALLKRRMEHQPGNKTNAETATCSQGKLADGPSSLSFLGTECTNLQLNSPNPHSGRLICFLERCFLIILNVSSLLVCAVI